MDEGRLREGKKDPGLVVGVFLFVLYLNFQLFAVFRFEV